MLFVKMQCISSRKTTTILTCKTSPSIGSADTRSVARVFFGPGKLSVGVITTSKDRGATASLSIGQSVTMISHHGIVMSRSLSASVETKTGSTLYLMANFFPAWGLSCIEDHFKTSVAKEYNDRHVIYARCAHLSEPQPIHIEQGRGTCVGRNLCQRGCPFGGYFNANSTTIPWAAKTGNLTLRPFSVVHSVIYDDAKGKATGVRVIDSNTKEAIEYFAPVIFVNAGAVNTNLILLNSKSTRFPNGIGNDNGVLGKYFAFHNYRGNISAMYDGMLDKNSTGGRPTSAYIPRFRNVKKQETDFLRGYAATFGGGRWGGPNTDGHGEELKAKLMRKDEKLGPWYLGSQFMGETIPKETNFLALDKEKKDEWGIPQISFNVAYDDNDEKMLKDFFEQYTEMFEKAGFTNIKTNDSKQAPGLDIHEMGGVRMGNDPKTSMLNKWNQMHNVPNLFVSDGACMTSTSTQNPSLTYMAITARAANHAIDLLKKNELK